MPKYQNTIIYKLHNAENTLSYVGASTVYKKRKTDHKCDFFNSRSKRFNLPVYNIIRNNGGWSSFIFTVLEIYPCLNKKESDARELYYLNLHGIGELNRHKPGQDSNNRSNYYLLNIEKYKTYTDKTKEKRREYNEKYNAKIKELKKNKKELNDLISVDLNNCLEMNNIILI